MSKDKRKGVPVRYPEHQGRGDAQPEGAGAEGGLGFVGDQRGGESEEDDPPSLDTDTPEGEPIKPVRKQG